MSRFVDELEDPYLMGIAGYWNRFKGGNIATLEKLTDFKDLQRREDNV